MASARKGFATTSIVALLLAAAALGLYGATLAPSLTLEHGGSDGAELAVAVYTRGIPHPTGYPSYVLLAQAFRVVPWGNLAGRLNFFSTLTAALTVGCVAKIAAELFEEERGLPPIIAALSAGLALMAAGLFWSQALISEVYTLHTLFLALACWLLLRWRRYGGANLPLAGLCLGLGLGNHLSLLLLLPGAALLLAKSHRRPRWWQILLTVALLLAGLSVYLYLPLRAASDPWLNWGNPRNGSDLWAHISGRAYHHYLFQVPWLQVGARLSAAAQFLLGDFAPWGVLLGIGGLVLLARESRPVLALTAIPAGLGLLLAVTYGGADSQVHLLPLYLAWALWMGVAAGVLTYRLSRRSGKAAWAALLLPLFSIPLLGRPLFSLSFPLEGWPVRSLRTDPGPLPGQAQILATLPPDTLLLTHTDETTFPLWYAHVVDGIRPDIAPIDVRLLEWPWYRQQLPSRYPGLIVPAEPSADDWLQVLLEANPGRPAFTLEPLPLPQGYRLRREGQAQRIVPP